MRTFLSSTRSKGSEGRSRYGGRERLTWRSSIRDRIAGSSSNRLPRRVNHFSRSRSGTCETARSPYRPLRAAARASESRSVATTRQSQEASAWCSARISARVAGSSPLAAAADQMRRVRWFERAARTRGRTWRSIAANCWGARKK
jgi:hypothetical protein